MSQPVDAIAIEVHRLNKRFAGKLILEQVTFSVQRGHVVGLLGPNGAGKTTLLRCLTGYLQADYGHCRLAGIDPALQPTVARAHFGYQPDLPPMEGALRAREYLALHGRLRGLGGKNLEARIDTVLHDVGLFPEQRKLVQTLSRGQRGRLAIAEALLHDPDILILDEPASGLDPAQVVSLRHLLRALAGKHTILVATHHLQEAGAVCDELVVLVKGRVLFQGTPTHLSGEQTLEESYLRLAGAGA